MRAYVYLSDAYTRTVNRSRARRANLYEYVCVRMCIYLMHTRERNRVRARRAHAYEYASVCECIYLHIAPFHAGNERVRQPELGADNRVQLQRWHAPQRCMQPRRRQARRPSRAALLPSTLTLNSWPWRGVGCEGSPEPGQAL